MRTTQTADTSVIVKVPFVNNRLARDVRRAVRSFSKDVREVFQSGRLLKDTLVLSSLSLPECPREVYQKKKKQRGRPVECHACHAGTHVGKCVSQDVIYSMLCSVCAEEYAGEAERTVVSVLKSTVDRQGHRQWKHHGESITHITTHITPTLQYPPPTLQFSPPSHPLCDSSLPSPVPSLTASPSHRLPLQPSHVLLHYPL